MENLLIYGAYLAGVVMFAVSCYRGAAEHAAGGNVLKAVKPFLAMAVVFIAMAIGMTFLREVGAGFQPTSTVGEVANTVKSVFQFVNQDIQAHLTPVPH